MNYYDCINKIEYHAAFKNMPINILLWGGVSSRTVDLLPAKLIKIIIRNHLKAL